LTRLLYIEWVKWRRFRPFQILICLYTVLFFLICFGLDDIILDKVIGNLTMGNYSSSIILEEYNPYKFPFAWHTFAFIGKFFKILLAILIINIISYEYQNGTFKQNIIQGLKRGEYLFGKFILVFLLSTYSTLLVCIAAIIGGLSHSTISEINFYENSYYLFLSFLNTFTYLSLSVTMGVIFRNTMTAFVILMLLWFPGDILWLFIIPENFNMYRPFEVIDELLPFTVHQTSVWKLITVSICYQFFYWMVSYFKMKKDLT